MQQKDPKKQKDNKETTKRRKYSRNGCIQCKQRKYKCDESKPSCKNCVNSKRECSYRQILKFKNSRSLTLNGATLSKIGSNKNSNINNLKDTKKTIPLSKPSTDPFLNLIPQVVQNPFGIIQQPELSKLPTNNNNLKNIPDFIPNNNLQNSNNNMTSQLDLENSLFNGATNLITDLNGLINSLEIDFNTLDFQTNINKGKQNSDISDLPFPIINSQKSNLNQNSQSQNQSQNLPYSLSNIRFEGISPTNYSIGSSDNQIQTPNFNDNDNDINNDINNDTSLLSFNNDNNNNLFNINKTKDSSNIKRKFNENSNQLKAKLQKKQKLNDQTNLNNQSFQKNNEEQLIIKNNVTTNKADDKFKENSEKEEEDDNGDNEDDEDDDEDEEEEEEEEDQMIASNNNYIQTLTQSLADYGTPKIMSSIKSPATDPLLSTNSDSRSYFKRFIRENSKAFPCPDTKTLIPFDYIEILNKTISDNDIELLASFFNWGLNSSHVKYLKIFVTHIHPNIIPFTTNYAHNAYIRIFLQQAKHAPHLLFAILAISARFEVYQIEQHPDLLNYEEKLNYHRTFRSYYLSSCLRSLESVLHSKQTTLNNIESLLLTIQVLASDFSGHKGSQWRTHLHGAKDLLIKYCRYRPLSLELTIVWLWFYSMEVLASLTAPLGGAIHDFDEMDEFLPLLCIKIPDYLKYFRKNSDLNENQKNDLLEPGKLTNALVHFGIAIEGHLENNIISRYNMYLGYDETILEVFNALVYAIECIRNKNNNNKSKKAEIYERKILDSQGKTLNSDFLLSLFALIKKARTFNYINNEPPYIVPLGKGVHPSELLKNSIDKVNEKNSSILENVYISAYIHPTQTSNETSEQTNNSNSSSNTIDSTPELPTPITNESPNSKIDPNNQQKSMNQTKEDEYLINSQNEIYFSWIDLSQQLNADASFLRLLTLHGGVSTYGLGIKSPLIQDIVSRMIMGLYGLVRYRQETAEEFDDDGNDNLKMLNQRYEPMDVENDEKKCIKETSLDSVKKLSNWPPFPFEKYLNYQFDNRLVMVPWALYICGLCCVEPRHKAVIECCFSGLIELGVGSGELSLKKLRKIWTLQKLRRFDYEKFNLFGQGFNDDDEDDYVPFM